MLLLPNDSRDQWGFIFIFSHQILRNNFAFLVLVSLDPAQNKFIERILYHELERGS